MQLNTNTFMKQGCFFLSLFSCNFDDNWAKIFTGLLFYAYVGMHLVKTLVFDNYQKYTLPLAWAFHKIFICVPTK